MSTFSASAHGPARLPRPSFSVLPLQKGGPRGNAWGLFGPDDELGLLNYITPEVVRRAAAEEIRTGVRIAIDLPLDHFERPMFHRQACKHRVQQSGDHAVHDDILHFNTQCSTQWDGFRHFGYLDHKLFYNNTTLDQVHNSTRMGTHKWVENGGLVTRGVLLDIPRCITKNGKTSKNAFEHTKITADELRAVMEYQGVKLRPGDILFVRSGFLESWQKIDKEAYARWIEPALPSSIGVEQSEEVLRLLWESGVVAVAGDMPAFEAWPPPSFEHEYLLHEWLLAGWGCPIGELFDLEKLADECEKQGRWSFFFTSMPLHIKGGVASPPAGVAIL